MSAVLRAENISYTYNPGIPGSKPAVDGVSLEIGEGEFIAVIGHTGSGKSTLIQHFNGLLRPQKGRVLFDGQDIWAKGYDLRALRFGVGLVFQYPEYQLFEETVYKDIAFGPTNMSLSEQEIHRRVLDAAGFVGAGQYLDSSPFELSGGEKRRVAIAGVLAMEPRVLILDEPAAGLDPRGKKAAFELIKNYHESKGATVIVVSHSMEDVAEYAKRVIVINRGQVFCDGSVPEVFKRARELSDIGLSIPAVTSILLRLKEGCPELNASCYDITSAADAIAAVMKERGAALC